MKALLVDGDAHRTDPRGRMAVDTGPFLSVDPGDLAELHRDLGRADLQVRTLEGARAFSNAAPDQCGALRPQPLDPIERTPLIIGRTS